MMSCQEGDTIIQNENIHGCLDSQATNYNSEATIDNNSCEYAYNDNSHSIVGIWKREARYDDACSFGYVQNQRYVFNSDGSFHNDYDLISSNNYTWNIFDTNKLAINFSSTYHYIFRIEEDELHLYQYNQYTNENYNFETDCDYYIWVREN
tara:strand:+ start:360 stop:812 length:453 start_codon:yes stop_codon:yes gene_type:complete